MKPAVPIVDPPAVTEESRTLIAQAVTLWRQALAIETPLAEALPDGPEKEAAIRRVKIWGVMLVQAGRDV